MRWNYAFWHRTRVKWFGPYENEEEAKTAFQTRYGYWPEDAIHKAEYVSPRNLRRL